ncbi:MAG: oligosaccharide flippase family protein [Phycisphaerales bacterium]|nr:oligosaccharide flippase family protein [Phycisphaerales bacterium]
MSQAGQEPVGIGAPPPPEVRGSDDTPPPPQALAGQVGAGVSWFALATMASRAASFVAQVVLGRLLTQEDFGVYAIAIAVATFLFIVRDAGVRDLLVHRASAKGAHDDGSMFWIAAIFNLVLGVIMVLTSGAFAWIYDEARLAPLLIVLAISVPLSTPGSMYYARLRVDMRFRDAASVVTLSAIVRFSSMIVLALMGFGLYSFAIPWTIVSIVEGILGWWFVRRPMWEGPPHFRKWPALLREVRWLLLARFGDFGIYNGDYLVAGKLLTTAAIGVYFFAFQLVAQTALLLSLNVQTVLLPALARLAHEEQRFAGALRRVLRTQAVWASFICFGLASVIEPLEHVLWSGRWAAAVPAMFVLSMAFPMRVTQGVTNAALQARGRFKAAGVLTALEALGFVTSACVGGLWGATMPDAIQAALALSIVMTIYIMGSRMVVCAWVFRMVHLSKRGVAADVLPAWACGLLACLAVVRADQVLAFRLGITAEDLIANALRFVAAGVLYCLLCLVLARVLIPGQLRQATDVVPQRYRARDRARRVLFLPTQSPTPMEPKADL